MKTEKRSKNRITSWDIHLDKKYGVLGTASRTEFEMRSQTFIISELLKDKKQKKHR